jgi:putative component of toxin-antitoxin plasmid stabilization module
MPILDTQKVTDDLVAAGFAQPQARVVTAKLEEAVQAARVNLVTVQDLERVKADLKEDIASFRAELKSDVAALRTELKGDTGQVRTGIAELDAKVGERMRNQLMSLVAAMIGVAGATLAAVKLLG